MLLDIKWFKMPDVDHDAANNADNDAKDEEVEEEDVQLLLEKRVRGSKEELSSVRDEILNTIISWHQEHTMTYTEAMQLQELFYNFFQDELLDGVKYKIRGDATHIYGFRKLGDRFGLQDSATDELALPTVTNLYGDKLDLQVQIGSEQDGTLEYQKGKVLDYKDIARVEMPLLTNFYNARRLTSALFVDTVKNTSKSYDRIEKYIEFDNQQKPNLAILSKLSPGQRVPSAVTAIEFINGAMTVRYAIYHPADSNSQDYKTHTVEYVFANKTYKKQIRYETDAFECVITDKEDIREIRDVLAGKTTPNVARHRLALLRKKPSMSAEDVKSYGLQTLKRRLGIPSTRSNINKWNRGGLDALMQFTHDNPIGHLLIIAPGLTSRDPFSDQPERVIDNKLLQIIDTFIADRFSIANLKPNYSIDDCRIL